MTHHLATGRIVWAEIAEANGIRKLRPAVIVTPTEQLVEFAGTGSHAFAALTWSGKSPEAGRGAVRARTWRSTDAPDDPRITTAPTMHPR